MLTDGELLYLALAALYLAECAFLLRGRAVAFVQPWGGAWRTEGGGGLMTARNATVHLRNPLPPLGRAVLCDASPVALAPGGIADAPAETALRPGRIPAAGRALQWKEVRSAARDGRTLLLNGRPFAEFATETAATAHAELVRKLAGEADAGRREAILRGFVRERFRTENGAETAEEIRKADGLRGVLGSLCILLFGWIFLCVPLLCFLRPGGQSLLRGAAAALLLSAVVIPAVWWRLHRNAWPQARGRRWLGLALAALCPPAAVRIQDSLDRERLAGLHPLAAAALLLEPDAFHGLAGRWLRDLRHPATQPADGTAAFTEAWRALLLAETERFLRQRKADPAALLAPPAPKPGCARYCPRCLTQYTDAAAACADCGGVPLEPLPAAGQPTEHTTP